MTDNFAFLHRSTPVRRSALLLTGLLAATWNLAPATGFAPGVAQAQEAITDTVSVAVLRVVKGAQVALPVSDVTRFVSANEDIAQARFSNGQAFIEGMMPGMTLIAVQQGTGENAVMRQYEVEVLEASDETTLVTETIPVIPPLTPVIETPVLVPELVQLTSSLNVEPSEDNPSQALFTITYGNAGGVDAKGVVIRYALDDMVSYVTNSATGDAKFNAAKRELSWSLSTLPANTIGQTVSFRVAALSPDADRFLSVATIEDSSNTATASNTLEYSFGATPLSTVFALPDRIIEGRSKAPFVDVKGTEYQAAINRLNAMGVLEGTATGEYNPDAKTKRSEYTVMILRGLNLRDLRDVTAIKFLLNRRSVEKLSIRNSDGRTVATLLNNVAKEAGEHVALWNGTTAAGYAAPGRYAYVCSARDAKGVVTELKGYINVIPQTPLQPAGRPSFIDVSPTAWYAGYLALGEKQGLIQGYPDKEFRPAFPINREEATAVIVRAIGLEDMAKRVGQKDSGFLDDHLISKWAKGYVYVASAVAKTSSGQLIVGYPSNEYQPLKSMRRNEAALIVQRLVDKETNRKLYVSGQMVPGTVLSINQRVVKANDDGSFSFFIEQNSAALTSVAVIDRRR